ncbi:hypothetical protein FRX31_030861, partial [Thalictrum thalictroides]
NVSLRERQSSNTRNHRGNYNYDRNDRYSDREGHWNNNSRPRASGRSYGRHQDRLASSNSRAERSWESHRHDSFPSANNVSCQYGIWDVSVASS